MTLRCPDDSVLRGLPRASLRPGAAMAILAAHNLAKYTRAGANALVFRKLAMNPFGGDGVKSDATGGTRL